jgi:putative FmdB family regulatory protein
MPIYEYKCPKGHRFELFQRMTDDPPETCEQCGAKPVERVLHAVAVHYKGSGFYSTDYGKSGGRKGSSSSDSSSGSSGSDGGGSSSGDSGSGGSSSGGSESSGSGSSSSSSSSSD